MTPHDWERKRFFNDLAEEWDKITHHDPDKLEFIVDLLSLQPGQAVLDVGTGTGVIVPFIYRHVKKTGRVVAVDYAENMIAVAKQRYPEQKYPNVKFLARDINDIPMKNEYNVILCYSCFPHFVNQSEIIKHLARGLKAGGKLMIAHSQSRDYINNLHKDDAREVRYDYLPSMAEIVKMLQAVGLKGTKEIDNDKMFVVIAEQP